MNDNRRAFERFGSDMIFWIRPEDADESAYQPFDIENISAGGILCLTTKPMEAGGRVIASFELPQHTDLIEALAQIRHCRKGEDGVYRVGIQFLQVEGVPQALLLDYLEELFK